MQTVILDSISYVNIGAIDTSILSSESELHIYFESPGCRTVSYKAIFEVCKNFVTISFTALCEHFDKVGKFYLRIKTTSNKEISLIRVNVIK